MNPFSLKVTFSMARYSKHEVAVQKRMLLTRILLTQFPRQFYLFGDGFIFKNVKSSSAESMKRPAKKIAKIADFVHE